MKSHYFVRTFVIFVFCIGLLFTGCGQAPLKTAPIAKTENPAQLITTLGKDLDSAKSGQVDVLSPGWFAQARKSHAQARQGLDKGTDLTRIWEDLSKGRAQLAQALQAADQSRYHLGEVIESRQMAFKAGAPRYKKEFADLEEDFLDATRAVEKKNHKYVLGHKEDLNRRYRELELRAIKDAALNEVRHELAALEKAKADKMAPQSHAAAVAKIGEADAFITGNRYAEAEIAARAAEAAFYTRRFKEIAASSTELKTMAPEKIALQVENYLYETAYRLGVPDQRDQGFDAQQTGIVRAIQEKEQQRMATAGTLKSRDEKIVALNAEIDTLKQQVAEIEGTSYQVKADKERLAAEKRFNDLYNKVQSYFSDNEAEVYKQGGQLVIRLKAIRFPVGQAVIVPENYGLLTKVQRAITTFGQPQIVVEGHTDSTGSQAKNEILSQQRAASVRAYLIANGTLPAQSIRAVGYGPNRPLAPNETVEGRAINRRIDVVIQPER